MGGLHRKGLNCTESLASDRKEGENLCSLVWSTVPMSNTFFIMPCLETLSPVCQAITSFYFLEQKGVIPFLSQHARNWETEAP